jgi:hypothetical protein
LWLLVAAVGVVVVLQIVAALVAVLVDLELEQDYQ